MQLHTVTVHVASAETSANQRACTEEEIEKALNCACVRDLRSGPCKIPFEGALVCYMKSDRQEKGRECYDEFLTLHSCLQDSSSMR